jgi:WD40 repeat protein
MYIFLRALGMHAFCIASLYAAAFCKLPDWQEQLKKKLVMPLTHSAITPGTATSMLYHPSSHNLAIWSRTDRGVRIYYVDTLGPKVVTSPDLSCSSDSVHEETLILDSDGTVGIVGTARDRVCILSPARSEPLSVRVKNKNNIVQLGAAAPLAGIMAIYARNCWTNEKHIGFCSLNERKVSKFTPHCGADEQITSMAFSHDGSRLAWGTDKGNLYTKQIESIGPERRLFSALLPCKALAWSPDKKTIAYSISNARGDNNWLILLAAASGIVLHEQKMSKPVTACTFIDTIFLAFCSAERTYMHRLYLQLPNIAFLYTTLDDLPPSAQKLCQKSAASSEPYELLPSEHETYKKLPELLRHAWLFKST